MLIDCCWFVNADQTNDVLRADEEFRLLAPINVRIQRSEVNKPATKRSLHQPACVHNPHRVGMERFDQISLFITLHSNRLSALIITPGC